MFWKCHCNRIFLLILCLFTLTKLYFDPPHLENELPVNATELSAVKTIANGALAAPPASHAGPSSLKIVPTRAGAQRKVAPIPGRKGNDVVVEALPTPHWRHVLSSSSDDHPTQSIRQKRLWECGLTILMRFAFAQICSPEYPLVIDIGMNVGWFTMLAAANGKQVVAFEPNPNPLMYANLTAVLNGWDSNRIDIIWGGVSTNGANLHLEDSHMWGMLRASQNGKGTLIVPSFRLDNIINPDANVCAIKADCQGCEGDAFVSGSYLFAERRVQVVMLEYDHKFHKDSKALAILRSLSPVTWHCVMLPLGVDCEASEMAGVNDESPQRVWDYVVAGIMEDCRPEKIDALVPHPPPGYYTDLWLMVDEVLARLRVHPGFVAARARRAALVGRRCRYSHQKASQKGPCDMYCHRFPSLGEAQRACDERPTCAKVVEWSSFWELRGYTLSSRGGGSFPKTYVKETCQ